MRKLAALMLLLFAGGSLLSASADGPKPEKIKGAVVACHLISAQGLAPCFDICFSPFIVRVSEPSSMRGKYIEVLVGHRVGEFPSKLLERRRSLRLRLKRFAALDAPLREFVPTLDSKTGEETPLKLPAWALLPGAEGEQLPFGETLPIYLLHDDISKLLDRL